MKQLARKPRDQVIDHFHATQQADPTATDLLNKDAALANVRFRVWLNDRDGRRTGEGLRAEKGCINYDLHQNDEGPAHFTFYENWESREIWQEHMNARHLAAYMAATDGAVAEFVLSEMSQID